LYFPDCIIQKSFSHIVYLFYIIQIVLFCKGVFCMSKAVIFFAPGLEECEGLLCVDLLRRSGVEVTIAAVGGEKIVKSARSISVVADALAEELDYSAFDAAILPGGIPGVDNLKADATVRKVCTEFAAAGKVVAAICAAPSVLAAFGILQGKKATVYPGMEDKLTAAGAEYTGLPITLDGNIITGEALGAAIPFALALASRLAGQQASNAVKQGIVYRY
jgi:4-methyl-5(b-hydroxyethyl)-thiazole monophosphate biosynthesis